MALPNGCDIDVALDCKTIISEIFRSLQFFPADDALKAPAVAMAEAVKSSVVRWWRRRRLVAGAVNQAEPWPGTHAAVAVARVAGGGGELEEDADVAPVCLVVAAIGVELETPGVAAGVEDARVDVLAGLEHADEVRVAVDPEHVGGRRRPGDNGGGGALDATRFRLL
ncbi:hypothetical protein OsI_36765 [Oryza sativa Indica Group]|uniref:Uncharacterized protein n=1 Tax=Oryza sativa subsp. indica TaxID=39946 RepID=B8BLG6_ORYSI|nr:hypothetical protein OsI_36765 [Oryza sativa Indica Group]